MPSYRDLQTMVFFVQEGNAPNLSDKSKNSINKRFLEDTNSKIESKLLGACVVTLFTWCAANNLNTMMKECEGMRRM